MEELKLKNTYYKLLTNGIILLLFFLSNTLFSLAQDQKNNTNTKLIPTKDDEIILQSGLNLNGNSFVEITDSDLLNTLNQKVTVSAWIKPSAFPNRYASILYKGDKRTPDISNRSYVLFLRNDGSVQFASSPKGQGEISINSASGSITLNRWYHVAGVIDTHENIIKLFIDGIEVSNTNFDWHQQFYESILPLQIGFSHEDERDTHSPFIGLIDEVCVWNKALVGNEIRHTMKKELEGDEFGLVAYWKFDSVIDGTIPDVSLNHNDGFLYGDANLIDYIRPIPTYAGPAQLQKLVNTYEKLLNQNPQIYEYYRHLAESLVRLKRLSDAENVYLQALDADLTILDKNQCITTLTDLYTLQNKKNEIIKLLEDLEPKMPENSKLFKMLGDSYQENGKEEKALNAYKQWITIRKKEVVEINQALEYYNLAEQLLEMNLFPDIALELASEAYIIGFDFKYAITLGHAMIINEKYEDSVLLIQSTVESLGLPFMQRRWFTRIVRAGKIVKNKDGYAEMLKSIINTMPYNSFAFFNTTFALAQFYQENNMEQKATALIKKTAFIAEDQWILLGPFDNERGIGCKKEYVREKLTQFDTTKKHVGKYGEITWRNGKDEIYNGYVSFGDSENWGVGYAYTTVFSPVEQLVEFRFDSDDQGKIWLNGIPVLEHDEIFTAEIDDYITPVTLHQGNNSILVKVCEQTGGWGFYFRITDEDGNPIEGLEIHSPELK